MSKLQSAQSLLVSAQPVHAAVQTLPDPWAVSLPLIVSLASLLISGFTIMMTRKNSLMTMQANILRDFQKEFDLKKDARLIASIYALHTIQNGKTEPSPLTVPPEVWQIFDFFDRVSMYLKYGYLDEKMVFVSFFYWMFPYWMHYEKEVLAMKDIAPLAMWDEIAIQIRRLKKVGTAKLHLKSDAYERAEKDIPVWFETEANECRPSSSRVPIL